MTADGPATGSDQVVEWRRFEVGDRVQVRFGGECIHDHVPNAMLDGELGTVIFINDDWPRGHRYAVHPENIGAPEWAWAMLAAQELDLVPTLAQPPDSGTEE